MNRPLAIGTKYICDYGCSHGFTKGMSEQAFGDETTWQECQCYKTYGCSDRMRRWIRDKGHLIPHSHDITQAMRDEYLAFNPHMRWEGTTKRGDHILRKMWMEETKAKLTDEDREQIKNLVQQKLIYAIKTGRAGPKFLNAQADLEIRRKYNCPY